VLQGAGNALMICQRNHSLMAAWYARYRSFSDQIWNGFSVRLPMEMAIANPGTVLRKLLPKRASSCATAKVANGWTCLISHP
jgi:hypothetical protein